MKWSLILGGMIWGLAGVAQAQGLVWSLPEDGTAVRYEGTYVQTSKQADAAQEDLKIEFRRIITLKSVGKESAEFQGKEQPCRWLEFKCQTGKMIEEKLEEGPGGTRIYKILVPESAVRGTVNETVADERQIHIIYLPIVKGFRKIGDEAATLIETGVFQQYPLISLLRDYQELEAEGETRDVESPAGNFSSVLHKGTMAMETATQRSTNTAEMERSEKFPFGVVKWTATTVVETKASTDRRDDFTPFSTFTETMEAAAVETGAESELTEK